MKSAKKVIMMSAMALSAITLSMHPECGIYKSELRALKKRQPYEVMFDKDANEALRSIIRDVENFKEMSKWQRMIRFMFLACDAVVVTHATMPKLHGYVASICKQQNIKTPVMFITKDKKLFNAMASKLFTSSGGIIIGQDMLNEMTGDELEAIVAHEVGHIVHNHVNKSLATGFVSNAASMAACGAFIYQYKQTLEERAEKLYIPESFKQNEAPYRKNWVKEGLLKVLTPSLITAFLASQVISSLIIGKRHEKQADRFSYATMGKGKGFIKAFERFQQKEQKAKDAFAITADAIDTGHQLPFGERFDLKLRFHLAKLGYKIDSAFRWWYYNTPFGAHPSHSSRIEAAKEYMDGTEE